MHSRSSSKLRFSFKVKRLTCHGHNRSLRRKDQEESVIIQLIPTPMRTSLCHRSVAEFIPIVDDEVLLVIIKVHFQEWIDFFLFFSLIVSTSELSLTNVHRILQRFLFLFVSVKTKEKEKNLTDERNSTLTQLPTSPDVDCVRCTHQINSPTAICIHRRSSRRPRARCCSSQ